MASENLEKALGRSIFDDNFRKKWLDDFDNLSDELDIADVRERIKAEHFLRDFERYKNEKEGRVSSNNSNSSSTTHSDKDKEKENTKDGIKNNYDTSSATAAVYPGVKNKELNFNKQELGKNESDKVSVNDYIFSIFQQTVEDSRKFFKKIFYLSYGVFAIGIIMFIISFLSGLGLFGSGLGVSSTIIFGVLGVITLSIYFIYNPSQKAQLGISNILKVEMIFMNFWDQLNFWRPYGNSSDDEKKKEASNQMHITARTSIEFLQQYLDDQKSTRNKLSSIFGRTFVPSNEQTSSPAVQDFRDS
ncbi:hypothetical protein [Candidatus Nitrosocosmicus franklandus]|uniref:Uncharacterized protein n=1 Tax=Candidatus Nitrosocosmicus franklandianus TaxID=1798806 RepID=A0A484I5B6_9ARCH|nr:hypothetical protein [Candidatus Nitrosocosmicus franklandus]VFJ12929.1 protein of unknown function [Candidatus Nitrosocosmicus franklandus]